MGHIRILNLEDGHDCDKEGALSRFELRVGRRVDSRSAGDGRRSERFGRSAGGRSLYVWRSRASP